MAGRPITSSLSGFPTRSSYLQSDPVITDYTSTTQPLLGSSASAPGSGSRGIYRPTTNLRFSRTTSVGSGNGLSSYATDPVVIDQSSQLEADRYTRLLEKELETVRHELKLAREKASNPESHKILLSTQEQLRQEQMRVVDLEREVSHLKETAHLQSSLQVADLQSTVSHLRQDLHAREQELRTFEQRVKSSQDQTNLEIERLRSTIEQLERTNATLRKEKDDLDLKLISTNQDNAHFQLQFTRRDDHIAALENELKQKQQRIDQAERSLSATQSQLQERDNVITTLRYELEVKNKRTIELDGMMQSLTVGRQDTEQKIEKIKRAYTELCDIIGATESQRQAFQVGSKLREMLADQSRLQQELLQTRQSSDLHQYEINNRQMKIDQLERDLANMRDTCLAREHDINALREELVRKSRELNNLATHRSDSEREERVKEERCTRLQEAVEQAERRLLEKERQVNDLLHQQHSHTNEIKLEQTRLLSERSHEITRLETRLAEAERQSRTDREYAEACRGIGVLLCIDPDTTASVHAQRLYKEVENLVREVEEHRSKISGEAINLSVVPRPHHPVDPYAPAHHPHGGRAHAYPPAYPAHHLTGGSYGGYDHGLGSSLPSAHHMHAGVVGDEHWLKSQLRENEERWVKLQLKHDSFKRSLTAALKLHESESESDIIKFVKALAKDSKHPHPPASSRPTTSTLRSRSGPATSLSTSSYGKDHTTTGHHHHNQTALLQEKLDMSMRHVELLHNYIETMMQKTNLTDPTAQHPLGTEIRMLREQVASLKSQLYGNEYRVGGVLKPSTGAAVLGASATFNEVSSQQAAISSLESRLQKHIEFREKIIELLEMKAISVPDYEIFQYIEKLMSIYKRSNLYATKY